MDTSVAGSYEDLGGPTLRTTNQTTIQQALKEPGGTLKQVRDVVNKGAKSADPMPTMKKEEEELSQEDTIEEDQEIVDEIVEEETETTEEYDVDEDVNALLGGEELSEEFKEKAKTSLKQQSMPRLLSLKKN